MTATKASPATPTSDLAGRTTAKRDAGGYLIGALRLAMGWYFFWPFLDKTFGLGFSTASENSWINGGSPTTGYLGNVEGPFAGLFNSMSGVAVVDWLFQLGLLGLGLALLLGIGTRVAAVAGTLMLGMMYLAALPLTTNPFLDGYIIEALLLILIAVTYGGRILGFGKQWESLELVQKQRWLI